MAGDLSASDDRGPRATSVASAGGGVLLDDVADGAGESGKEGLGQVLVQIDHRLLVYSITGPLLLVEGHDG